MKDEMAGAVLDVDPAWIRWALGEARERGWELRLGTGPVLATAIHAGHAMRPALLDCLAVDGATRRRDEDPLTNLFTASADHAINVLRSRFEVDLNRERHRALATDPEDTWGVRFWRRPPPEREIERSLESHDAFYGLMQQWIEGLLARWGRLLVLDIHSYNHRRQGPERAEPEAENPEIDLGLTELDPAHWSGLVDRFREALRGAQIGGRGADVRDNVRYPDGGHFPEWIHALYPEHVCVITLEIKKFYMDEWTGHAELSSCEALRGAIAEAIAAVRQDLCGT